MTTRKLSIFIQRLTLAVFIIASAVLFPLGSLSAAGAPLVVSYQGRLADASGNLVGGASGTTYYFKFSFWTTSSVGTGARLWPTGAPTSYSTTVKQGVFNVNIGDTGAGYPDVLDYDFSNPNVYVQVEVSSDNVTFETLGPRQQLTSAVFAHMANAVIGASSTIDILTSKDITTVRATTTSATSTNFFSTNIWGTALNTSGLATLGNLLATGSSTLQNFTALNSTSSQATTTSLFATNAVFPNLFATKATTTEATTTNFYISGNLYGANLSNCDPSSGKLMWADGRFFCGLDAGGSGGSGITSIGVAGSYQSGVTQTFATTSDTNIQLSIVSSSNTHTFSPSWVGQLAVARGGTGLGSVSQNGLLIGGAGNTITQVATSSLGISSSDVTEGSKLFYTTGRVQTYLDTLDKGYYFSTTSAQNFVDASTTIPKTYSSNTFTGSNTFNQTITGSVSGNAGTVTNGVYTTTFGGLFDTALAATTTLNNLAVLKGVTDIIATRATTTAATSTNFFATTASTTNLFATNLVANTSGLTESGNLFYTDGRVQTYLDTLGKGYFFSTTSADYYTDASTTIPKSYSDNTFSGSNSFNQTITGSISGNAGTVTNGVYTTTFGNLFDARLSATTTLPNLAILKGVTDLIATRATTTSATSTNLFATNATLTNLAVSSTISGSITGNAGTATTLATPRTINGVSFDGSQNITVAAASSTLLANDNTFSGSNTFSQTINGSVTGNAGTVTNGVYTTTFNNLFDNRLSATTTLPNLAVLKGVTDLIATRATTTAATSTNLFATTGVFTNLSSTNTITGSVSGNAGTATTLQNSRNINGVAFNGSADITVNAASSTALTDNNTFSGANTFSQTITGSISGNAGTVTNGVYTTTFNGLFDNRLSATTTLPNLQILKGVTDLIATRATTTEATTTNFYISGNLYGANLSTCNSSTGKLIWQNGQFGCGTDAGSSGSGITAIGAQYSTAQGGATQTFATSSDTNIGLVITSGSDTHTFTPTWIGTLAAGRGGTGISNPSSAGILLGSYAGGGWQQLATSSLGLLTTNVAEGTNLYYTQTRFDNALSATTTLPNIAVLKGLTDTITTRSTTTNATTTSLFSTNLSVTNTINGSVSGNAGSATVLQTARNINGVSFNGSADITVNAASSTALSDNNTFSGANSFSQTITGSISGNAGTVTNGVYTTTFGTLFDNRLSATTTLPNLTTLKGLTDLIATRATTTSATTTNFAISSITSKLLKTDANGVVTAATAGTDYLATAVTSLQQSFGTAQTGAATLATTSQTTNGLTTGLNITNSGATFTFNPTISGTLTAGGGGTGISSPSSAGILLGTYAGGGWQQLATSSLGLLTTNVAEGTNLYWTQTRFDNALSSTTTLPNLAVLKGVTDLIATRATTTQATSTNFFSTNATVTNLSATKLSNLTQNGFVKTSGGDGTLSVDTSTYLTSAITAIGPTGQTQAGPTVTIATSSTAFNGLTASTTVTGSGNTLTFANTLAGTLGAGGGGTGISNPSAAGILLGSYAGGSYQQLSTSTLAINFSNMVGTVADNQLASTFLKTIGSGTNGQLAYWTGANTLTGAATSSISVGNGISVTSGSLGNQVGGTNVALGLSSIAANSVLANNTSGSAVPTALATSSLFIWNGTGNVVRDTTPTITTPILNAGGVEIERITTAGVGNGTTTPVFSLMIASSTKAQLALSDGSISSNAWTFRNAGGNFYLATSSPSTFATSTNAALSINTNGIPTFAALNTAGFVKANSSGTFSIDTNTYLTAAVTAVGPTGQTQAGPTITIATSSTAFNGLTASTTVTGSGNTLTFANTLAGTLGAGGGGTGISNPSVAGILLGSYAGGSYQQLATSSLGLLTTNVAEGTNLYYTQTRFDNALSSTTTLPNLQILKGVTDLIATRATTTQATTTNFFSTNATVTNLSATKLSNLTSNGFVKTSGGDGTLSVDTSTYLTSAVTAIGPTSQTQSGPSVTIATSSTAFNGLTASTTVTGSGNTLTFANTLAGLLTAGGGGTGISNPSAAGILLGSYAGGSYQQLATSSLGLLTTNVAEGTNQYFTNARADARINATTTLGTLQFLANLVNTTTTAATTTNLFSTTASSTNLFSQNAILGSLTVASCTGCTSGSGITALGPTGQTQSGPTITIATSSTAFNGLTASTTVTGSGNTLTFTNTMAGLLGAGGGGTGISNPSAAGILLGSYAGGSYQQLATSSLAINFSNMVGTVADNQLASTFLKTIGNGTNGQLAYWTGANTLTGAATSSISVGNGVSVTSGSLGNQVGGTNVTLGLSTIAANSVLANVTSGTAVPTALATSSLFVWNGTGNVVRDTSPTITSVTDVTPVFQSAAGTEYGRIVAGGFFGAGTTTPQWQLELASSTRSQLTLSDGSLTSNHWSFRNAGGNFYLATSSPSTFATSTNAAFSLNANGVPTFAALNTAGFVKTNSSGTFSIDTTTYLSSAVTSLQQSFGTAQTGAITLATSTQSLNGMTYGVTVTNSGGTFTFTPSNSGSLNVQGGGTGQTTFSTSQLLYGAGTGAVQSVATSSPTFNNGLTTSGTAGFFVGGSGYTIGLASIAANSILANVTSGTAVPTALATSSLFVWNGTGNVVRDTSPTVTSVTAVTPVFQSAAGTEYGRIVSGGFFGVGTTTPQWQLELASSTRSQLTLSDASLASNHWSFRNAGGIFYLATSSPSTFATSTKTAFSIDTNGIPTFSSLGGSTGCAQFSSTGVLSNTGSVCGTAGGGSPGGSGTELQYRSGASTFGAITNSAFTSALGTLGIGTTTPQFLLELATSSKPQLVLSDGSLTSNHWTFRNAGGVLYLSTASPSTFATTSSAALSLDTNGGATFNGFVSASSMSSSNDVAITNGSLLTQTVKNYNAQPLSIVTEFDPDGVGSQPLNITTGNSSTASAGDVSINAGTGATTNGKVKVGNSGSTVEIGISALTTFDSSVGAVGIGTTTPKVLLGLATSTGPQLSLSDASLTSNKWTFRNAGGIFYLATSSPSTFATSSKTAFSIDTNGIPTFSSLGGSTGCAQISSTGQITNSGSACGGAGGSPSGTGNELQYKNGSSFGAVTNSAYTSTVGALGLGTTTPQFLLQLASSTKAQLALSDGSLTSNAWTFRNAGGALYIATSSPSTFATTSVPAISIINGGLSGLIGIGTSTPMGKLSVEMGTSDAFIVSNQGSTTPSLIVKSVNGNGNVGIGTWNPAARFVVQSTSATDQVMDVINFAGVSSFHITSAGLVGIGTTTPAFQLELASSTRSQLVLSDASLTSNQWAFRNAGGNLYISTSSPSTYATSSIPALAITSGGVSGLVGVGTTSPLAKFAIEMGTSDAFIVSNQGSTTPSFIVKNVNSNGTVGIGTFTPTAAFDFTSTQTLAPTNGLVRFNFNGIRTTAGNGFQIDDISTTLATVMAINANSLTTGNGLTISSTATGLTGTALSVTTGATGVPTNGLVRFNFNGARTGNGTAFRIDDISTTLANVMSINANSLTTGNALAIYTNGVRTASSSLAIYSNGINAIGGTASASGITISMPAASFTGLRYIRFANAAGTEIGSVTDSAATTIAYNTSSDRRLKMNIADTHFGLDDLMKVHVRDFNWIADGSADNGFIAQELYNVYPYAVTKGDDGTEPYVPGVTNTWEIDYGRLTPFIIKGVQDLDLKVDAFIASSTASSTALEAKTAFLESSSTASSTSLAVHAGLSVDGGAVFHGGLVVNSIGTQSINMDMLGDVTFYGRPFFTGDTAGTAVVRKGANKVEVTFDRDYIETPIVSAEIAIEEASSTGDTLAETIFSSNIRSIVTHKSLHGFTILLNKPAPDDISFSWIALPTKGAKLFTSRDTDVAPQAPIENPVTGSGNTAGTGSSTSGTDASTTPDTGTSSTTDATTTPPATSGSSDAATSTDTTTTDTATSTTP